MTGFSPIVTTTDLGTYLSDSTINVPRAALFIEQAQILCQSVVNPLPDGAEIVVMRMAGRAYETVTQSRYAQAAAAGMPFGANPAATGEVRLFPSDEADLRRLAGGGGAFSIDLLPSGYVAPVSYDYDGFDTFP